MADKYVIEFAHEGKGYAIFLDLINGKLEKVHVEKTGPWVGSGTVPKKDVHVSKLEKALQYKPIKVKMQPEIEIYRNGRLITEDIDVYCPYSKKAQIKVKEEGSYKIKWGESIVECSLGKDEMFKTLEGKIVRWNLDGGPRRQPDKFSQDDKMSLKIIKGEVYKGRMLKTCILEIEKEE